MRTDIRKVEIRAVFCLSRIRNYLKVSLGRKVYMVPDGEGNSKANGGQYWRRKNGCAWTGQMDEINVHLFLMENIDQSIDMLTKVIVFA